VKLLFDQNLPRSLLSTVEDAFPGSTHVALLGLDKSSDKHIFDFARLEGFTIVSKDSDFRQLSFVHGAPPKVIWLRVGNRSAKELRQIVSDCIELFQRFEDDQEAFLVVERGY
jgi:predicted nuclease of predicted toxin-antitoxin system